MRVLVDTHTFIWYANGAKELSPRVEAMMNNSMNDIFLSCVSVWEMQLKISKGKLELKGRTLKFVVEHYARNRGFHLINVELDHILGLEQLPLFDNHKDPFDRMLVVQAIQNNLILATDRRCLRQHHRQ